MNKEEKTRFITKALGLGSLFQEFDIYYDRLEKERPGSKEKYRKWLEELADTKMISSFN